MFGLIWQLLVAAFLTKLILAVQRREKAARAMANGFFLYLGLGAAIMALAGGLANGLFLAALIVGLAYASCWSAKAQDYFAQPGWMNS